MGLYLNHVLHHLMHNFQGTSSVSNITFQAFYICFWEELFFQDDSEIIRRDFAARSGCLRGNGGRSYLPR
jgi:hypothetical protein